MRAVSFPTVTVVTDSPRWKIASGTHMKYLTPPARSLVVALTFLPALGSRAEEFLRVENNAGAMWLQTPITHFERDRSDVELQ